ncbi:uncharacterized protein LOC120698968 isoform X2 [Panicum virgatum]|uniref:uncharacterized protein LOC120698968 isoform X2 n=1 Tax=Panicum virgatum TaxID=38727 RepID=UPI0019D5AB59|nr:uncharacterized protein LOC120698968 isoform X2 [Panicum virgatum]
MEAERESTEPTAVPPSAAVRAVLGDDDLLREILLRLAFPTALVRAAPVSRRWLRHASDPAFLRRFRRLHPPVLLGFYLRELGARAPRFVPVSRAPELAAAAGQFFISDCRNGRLLVTDFDDPTACRHAVLSPLRPGPARGKKAVLPPAPKLSLIWFFLTEKPAAAGEDDGAVAVLMLPLGTTTKAKLQVDLLASRSGAWVVRQCGDRL